MRYRINQKVSRRRQRQRRRDPHQKQYVLLHFGGGHKYLDILKNCSNYSKILTMLLYHREMRQKMQKEL